MSASPRAPARYLPGAARRLLVLITLLPLATGLAIGVASAEPPPAVAHLSAADARRSGVSVALLPHDLPGARLLTVALPAASTGTRLLAAAPDGSSAALAASPFSTDGELTIAAADGAQLRVRLPGVSGAGFAPEGDRLAVIDGAGSVWLVDARSGESRRVADGPFVGSPSFETDGSLLVLAASSFEAPYRSQPVLVAIADGTVTPISDDELVYAVFPLADGARALVVHERGGTVVKRLSGADSSIVAELGPDATGVTVSTDGMRVAFQRGEGGVFLIDRPGAPPHRVGDGSDPTLSPDGNLLLVRRGASTTLFSADGSVVAEYEGTAAFIGCVGGCLP